MSTKRLSALFSLCVVLTLALSSALPGAAQESKPLDPGPNTEQQQPEPPVLLDAASDGPVQSTNGLWMMPAGAASAQPVAQAPVSTGGPDEFGYTWDDSVPLNWISASIDHAGPLGIGFPFKYYENTYSQLYVSRFGFLAFNDTGIYNSQSRIPSAAKPDDVIAPHWVPADRLDGYARYVRGGTAPNRWFVVEWNRLERGLPCWATLSTSWPAPRRWTTRRQ